MKLTNIADWYRRQNKWVQRGLALADVAINGLTGGEWGETLSERWAENAKKGDPAAKKACEILGKADPGHCSRADSPKH